MELVLKIFIAIFHPSKHKIIFLSYVCGTFLTGFLNVC